MTFPSRFTLAAVASALAAGCLPEGDKFACTADTDCVSGYVCFQAFCQKADAVKPCDGFSCGANGACEAKDRAATCKCNEGYAGAKCDTCDTGWQDKDTDGVCARDCATAAPDCGPGSCVDTSGTATCECPVGNEGADCKTCKAGFQDADGDGTCTGTCATTGLDCGDHGECSDATGTAKCDCEAEYAGNLCDACADGFQDDDDDGTCNPTCAETGLQCGDHGTCATTSGFAACECEVMYAGTQCETCAAGTRNDFGVCKGVTKFFGDNQSQEGLADVVFHQDGSLLMGIGFTGTTNFTNPPTQDNGAQWGDAMFVRVNPSGAIEWATRVGGTNREGLGGIDEDGDGNLYAAFWNYSAGDYLVGNTTVSGLSGGMSVFSLDRNGAYRWNRSFGGGELHHVAADRGNGNIFFAGIANSAPDFGDGPVALRGSWDAILYSTDTNGTLRFARSVGSAQGDGFGGIAVGPDHNIYVVGHSEGTPDLGQSGGSYPKPFGTTGAFVASYTATGQHRWSRFYAALDGTNEPFIHGQAVSVSPDGSVWVALGGRGKYDFGKGEIDLATSQTAGAWLRYDSNGNIQAARYIIAGAPVSVKNITFDSKNNAIYGGNINNGGAVVGDDPTKTGGGPFWAQYRPDFTSVNYGFARSGAYPWVGAAWVRGDGVVQMVGVTNNTNMDWGSGVAQTPGNSKIWWAVLPPVPPPL